MIKYAQNLDPEWLQRQVDNPNSVLHKLKEQGALESVGEKASPGWWDNMMATLRAIVAPTTSPGRQSIGYNGAFGGGGVPLNNYPTYVPKKPVPAPAPAAALAPAQLNPAINAPALARGHQLAEANANAILQDSIANLVPSPNDILSDDALRIRDSIQQQLYANVEAQEKAKAWEAIARQHPKEWSKLLEEKKGYDAMVARDAEFGEALANANLFGTVGSTVGVDTLDEIDPEAATQNAKAISNIQEAPLKYIKNEDYPVVPELPTYDAVPKLTNPITPTFSAADIENLAAQTIANNVTTPAYTPQDAEEAQNNARALGQQFAASLPQTQPEIMPSLNNEALANAQPANPSFWDNAINYMSAHPVRTTGAAALGALGLGALAYNAGKKSKKRKKS